MKNILVTGYTGFVGKNLTEHLLSEGDTVTGIGRKVTGEFPFSETTYDDLPSLKNYDAVVHLAGKAHDLKKTGNDADYFEANSTLTVKVFEQFLQSNATDFIYLSSVKAAADKVEGILLETHIPSPATAYGKSKLEAENYLLKASLPEGKRLIILRPCMIHGPGNKGNLNLLYKFIKSGIPYPLAAFENRRSVLSIKNLLFTITVLLNNKHIPGGIYNIADDEPLATTQIIDTMAGALAIKPLKWFIRPQAIKWLASAGDVLNLPFNSERLEKLTENYVVSNEKIKKAAGISSLPVTARDGLIYTTLNM